MSAAGDGGPQAGDERARLLAGYGRWDTPSVAAELARNELDLERAMTPEVREHTELRVQVLREILTGRDAAPADGRMTAGP